MSDEWEELTALTIDGLRKCPDIFQPTNFWGPGVTKLLEDMKNRGLDQFKRWPQSLSWFYPVYGNGFNNKSIHEINELATRLNPKTNPSFIASHLSGGWEARRDYDVASLAWDQSRWPFDLSSMGESIVGNPPQRYRLSGQDDVAWGRPYLNYLLSLAALSRHVEQPPQRFLEIGGGFGVLGEIVMSRDSDAIYVDLDIPPLITVASYYLTSLFGREKVELIKPDEILQNKLFECDKSTVLPNWKIDYLIGEFDVFVNSFSFQEMEPNVVEHYANAIATKRITYVVSLNSKNGKKRAMAPGMKGALDPVTSNRIENMFVKLGYKTLGKYGSPLLRGAGELLIMKLSI